MTHACNEALRPPKAGAPSFLARALAPGSPLRPPSLWTWPQAKAKGAWAEGFLVDESQQVTGSFKWRAAWAVASSLPHSHLATASSGNFGAALACAAARLNKSCTVLMPLDADASKQAAVRAHGAEVVFIDTQRESRAAALARWAQKHPAAYLASPYDDELCIAGNASLGLAIASLKPDVVLCPVGGGGLAAGILEGLRAGGSQAILVGAEPALANDVAQSWRLGKRIALSSEPTTMADGLRTPMVGEACWARLEHGLSDMIEVQERAIASAFSALRQMGILAEPSAAVAPAAAWRHAQQWQGKVVCAIVCGGNVSPERAVAIAKSPAAW